ncbi:MAG: HAD family phosphatase [Pseudomonadota bacterium]
MNLCLFDLDDTLLPLDSDHAWGEFVIRLGWVDETSFRQRNNEFFEAYQAGRLDVHAYVAFSTEPLRARSASELQAAQDQFMAEVILPKLLPPARALVQDHQRRGDLVALVTATNEFITAPIARALGIADLIAVRLVRDATGTITGRIDGVPSYQHGKVTRVTDWLASRQLGWDAFERVSVYSDSVNDLPLLERATDPVATNPSPALQAQAQARGWRTLQLFS